MLTASWVQTPTVQRCEIWCAVSVQRFSVTFLTQTYAWRRTSESNILNCMSVPNRRLRKWSGLTNTSLTLKLTQHLNTLRGSRGSLALELAYVRITCREN